MGKSLKAYSDLDLDPKMQNIELVRVIFIYYKNSIEISCSMNQFLFELSCKTHTHKHKHFLDHLKPENYNRDSFRYFFIDDR